MSAQDESKILFTELADLEVGHAHELAQRASKPPLNLEFDALGYVEKLEKRVAGKMSPMDKKTVRTGSSKAVLKLAKQREADARDIYQRLARETEDPSMKAFCEELSFMEQAHLNHIGKLERAMTMPNSERPSL
jgi:rubrerythrin